MRKYACVGGLEGCLSGWGGGGGYHSAILIVVDTLRHVAFPQLIPQHLRGITLVNIVVNARMAFAVLQTFNITGANSWPPLRLQSSHSSPRLGARGIRAMPLGPRMASRG